MEALQVALTRQLTLKIVLSAGYIRLFMIKADRSTDRCHKQVRRYVMEPAELLALYEWAAGICFRHPGLGEVETAHLKTLHPRTGEELDIRGCRECVLILEGQRERASARSGCSYQPGRLGRSS